MTLHPIDHLAFLMIVLVWPAFSFVSLRRRAAAIQRGRVELRMKMYRAIVIEEWIQAAVLVALWFALGRSAAALGFTLRGDTLAWAGYGLTAAISAFLVLQVRVVARNPAWQSAVRGQVGWLSFLMPQTPAEQRMFEIVSVTAGICEEILYRGFLFAYLAALFGAPLWLSVLLSSALFGLAHSYQGPAGIVRTGAAGLVFGVLYAMTGSLWGPMIVHTLLDVTSGRITRAAFADAGPPAASPEPAT